ncbi:MAG: WG repeat-containing protein [Haliscomenobacter sp.]|nr:WG repeat-containing protein [Haliscomenobacter sp.]
MGSGGQCRQCIALPQYDDIRVASKGLYWVQVGGKANDEGYIEGGQWGLVDSLGNVLLGRSMTLLKVPQGVCTGYRWAVKQTMMGI